MAQLTREDFASAVSATLSSVHHLYREIHRLVGALREGLAESPDTLVFFGGTAARSGRDQGRLVVRNDYTMLFKPLDDAEDMEDEDDDGSDDVDEDSEPGSRRRRPPATISSRDVLLAVAISVHDPRGTGSFEPHLSYAALDQWSVGSRPASRESDFVISRRMLTRIPKVILAAGLEAGMQVQTTASVKSEGRRGSADRRLSCVLSAGVKSEPLYALDDAAALEKVVQDAKAIWRRVAEGQG